MSKLFDLNNPLMQGLTGITNLLLLSCMWLVASIPLLTIGPATAALYYVAQKIAQGENPHVFRCFVKSFRDNLKQGILLGLIFGAAAVLMYYDYVFSYIVGGTTGTILRGILVIMAAVWLMVVCYTFPLQAQFRNTVKYTLKNALFLSIVHIGKTITLIALHLIPAVVCLVLPELFARLLLVWLFVAPGVIAFLASLRMKKLWLSLVELAQVQSSPKKEEDRLSTADSQP